MPGSRPESAPAVAADIADPAQVKQVIQLLESETARTEFLNNLKAVHAVQQQTAPTAETPQAVSTQAFSTQAKATDEALKLQSLGVAERYRALLDQYGLSETTMGRWLLMCLSSLVYVVLLIVFSRAGHWLEERIIRLQEKYNLHQGRIRRYFHFFSWIVGIFMTAALLFSWAMIWDIADIGNIQTSLAYVVVGKILHFLLVIVLGIAVWEVVNGLIEYALTNGKSGASVNRVRTLLPIARSISFAIVGILFALVLLSEMGIDIMPMLAGAGVIGVAIGFGAQTVVKDYITGFTILMEDLIRVGDVANLGGNAGVVELITLRKVQLRGADGTVYTVPYSEIKVIQNNTKDFSYFIIDQTISYRQDPAKLYEVMREVDEDLRADPNYADDILAPLEIWGLDRIENGNGVVKARIKTAPGKQWSVGREFNTRLKAAINEAGIEIGNPNKMFVVNETPTQPEKEPQPKAG